MRRAAPRSSVRVVLAVTLMLGASLAGSPAALGSEGTLAIVNLSTASTAAARAIARRFRSLVGGWARNPGIAELLLADPRRLAVAPDPTLGEIVGVLARVRGFQHPSPGELSRLGQILSVDYLLLVRERGQHVRLVLFSVHLGASAPRALHTRMPELAGLGDYIRRQTGGSPAMVRSSMQGSRLPFEITLPGSSFTHDEMRRARLRVALGFWLKTISGQGRLDVSRMVPDDRVSLREDLGLDENDGFVGRVEYQPWRGHRLRFGYTPSRFSARTTLERSVRFKGIEIGIKEMIEAEVSFDFYEISYWYDLFKGDYYTVAVGAQLNVCNTGFRLEDLGNPASGVEGMRKPLEDSRTVPIPYLGLVAEYFPFKRFGIVGEVKGFSAGRAFSVVDAELGARLNLFRNFSVSGGYRITRFDIEVLDQEFHFSMEGAYVMAGFHLWTGAH